MGLWQGFVAGFMLEHAGWCDGIGDLVSDYYEQQFDFDEKIDWKRMSRWLEWIEINNNTGKNIIDMGCGIGRSSQWAKRHGTEWTGIDICKRAVRTGKERYNANLLYGDATAVKFPDNSFDFVVALGSIEHFDNPEQGIKEMYRLLKKDGYGVILVPSYVALLESIGLYTGTEQPYELRLSKKNWGKMITDAGFTICKVRKDYGPPVFKNFNPLKIIQRVLIKLTKFTPDCFTYCWIFELRK